LRENHACVSTFDRTFALQLCDAVFQRAAPVAAPTAGFGTPARLQAGLRALVDALAALGVALPTGLGPWLDLQAERLAGRLIGASLKIDYAEVRHRFGLAV
jgi:hypothetical protein